MNGRARRVAIFFPVVVTVALTALVGALVIVQNQDQAEQVTQAEDAGNSFLRDVGVFRSSVVREVNRSKEADPARLRRVVERAIADPPVLQDAPDYGIERSDAYARAASLEETFLQPYRRLIRELARADVALDFIEAAREVLDLRASEYVGFGLLSSSDRVRGELIPAFVSARDEFAQVRVPKGQDELAAIVRDAVQYVIDQATILADRIDANQSFSFTYGEEFQRAAEAVDGYATVVTGDVTEAINAVTDVP